MVCRKCGSFRLVRFFDGFGQRRMFCKKCWGSFIDIDMSKFDGQKNLRDFDLDIYNNPRAIVRHFR